MRNKITLVGNWKMHGSKAHVASFFAELHAALPKGVSSQIETVVCPPAVFLPQCAELVHFAHSLIKLGGQDCSAFDQGAYTGQIAPGMLKEQGCTYVIVGHSERRQYNQESDEEIANKFLAAKKAGIIPILCVGETQAQREQNLTDSVIVGQLNILLKQIGASAFKQAMVAYEPVWAIGTGLTATPEQAQAVHALLRATVAEYDREVAGDLPILYGGSVKASNAKDLFSMPDIDGALVGGASLKAQDFWAICEMAFNS